MKVYEAVAQAMVDQGVRAVFGLMGDGNLKILPHLTTELDVAFYSSRHEAGCVAMADGYARVTGDVGVCTFTQGPGLTNAMTALVSAQRGRSPLVVLCGDTPTVVSGLPQDIEQRPILAAAGSPCRSSTSTTRCPASSARSGARGPSGGPIALVLPTDLQDQECEWTDAPAPGRCRGPVAAALTSALVGSRPQAINGAERPVVDRRPGRTLVGCPRARSSTLADRTGALLATSLLAKGWFDDHPFDVGIAGGFSSDRGRRLIQDADCVVVFGASLNHFTSRGGTLFCLGRDDRPMRRRRGRARAASRRSRIPSSATRGCTAQELRRGSTRGRATAPRTSPPSSPAAVETVDESEPDARGSAEHLARDRPGASARSHARGRRRPLRRVPGVR